MRWRRVAYVIFPFLWTTVPALGFERLTEHYYIVGDPTFFALSGPRLEVFIVSFFLGAVASGILLGDFRRAATVQLTALATVLLVVYFACTPAVCYSLGPDGIEPARLGGFLGALTLSGVALGARPREPWELALAAVSSFFAVSYYPVIFDLAGARLLQPLHPWAMLAVLGIAAYALSAGTAAAFGRVARVTLPLVSLTALWGVSLGIAWTYLQSVSGDLLLMVIATIAGSTVGVFLPRRSPAGQGVVWAVAVVLVLAMTVLVIPDEVSGVMPASSGSGLIMGTPVYVGGYMDAQPGHAAGVAVTENLAGTNAASIQPGNFVSAGLGVHSAGCCVDGIDYAYRFDLYYEHSGNESLVATGWEICDDNIACGGHSWKVLLLDEERPLGVREPAGNVTLRIEWRGREILWSYSLAGGDFMNFTTYHSPSQENPNFNTGVAEGGSLTSMQSGAYFYQFGVTSRYPIGGGWSATFYCPSLEINGSWSCVPHSKVLEGGQSFWKVLWRWGEDYPNVLVESPREFVAVFQSSPGSATKNFQKLW